MHLTAPAIVVAVLPHGEHGVVGRFLTRDHGLVAGYVRGGRGRRLRAVLQAGNGIELTLARRTDSQLAAATIDAGAARAGITTGGVALAAIGWLTTLTATALPEGAPHPRLFDTLNALLDGAAAGVADVRLGEGIVRFELLMLAELGFGIDLSACVATGDTAGLAYVSPRSSQAVSAAAGAPYAAKLLPLPAFLTGGSNADAADVMAGLQLTGHFVERDLIGARRRERGRDILAARALFTARLAASPERLAAVAG